MSSAATLPDEGIIATAALRVCDDVKAHIITAVCDLFLPKFRLNNLHRVVQASFLR